MKYYAIGVVGTLLILWIVYLLLTRDKRWFANTYEVKLPFLCTVRRLKVRDDKYDHVYWGKKRYRRIRKDGKKDRRFSGNFRITYPTTITIGRWEVKIWNMQKAQEIYKHLSLYMNLPLWEIVFKGEPKGDIYKFIGRYKIEYVRYVAKLFEMYGWRAILGDDKGRDIVLIKDGQMWVVKCFWSKRQFTVDDLRKLPKIMDSQKWIVVSLAGFNDLARKYIFKAQGRCIDEECIRDAFLYREMRFL